jgi:hypothetical protein
MSADVKTKAKASPEYQKHPEVTIPGYIGRSITSLLVFVMAATMRGQYLSHFLKLPLYGAVVTASA